MHMFCECSRVRQIMSDNFLEIMSYEYRVILDIVFTEIS
jgi:hypothetical protein